MHADAQRAGQFDIAVEQPLHALAVCPQGLFDQHLPLRVRGWQAQLDALLARGHRLLQLVLPALRPVLAVLRRRGDQVAVWLAQCGHHRQVGRRHRIAAQLVRRYPGDGLALAPARGPLPAADVPHVQGQVLVRVMLRHVHDPLADLGLDAELLAQFTHQRLFGRLAGLALAAREFPQAGHVAVLGTAVEQDAATGVGDDAGHDMDRSFRGRHGQSMPTRHAACNLGADEQGAPCGAPCQPRHDWWIRTARSRSSAHRSRAGHRRHGPARPATGGRCRRCSPPRPARRCRRCGPAARRRC